MIMVKPMPMMMEFSQIHTRTNTSSGPERDGQRESKKDTLNDCDFYLFFLFFASIYYIDSRIVQWVYLLELLCIDISNIIFCRPCVSVGHTGISI